MNTVDKDLELAAKAAGYRINPEGRTDGNFLVLENEHGSFIWNPKTSNDDAFKLAVDLGISLEMDSSIEVDSFTYQGVTEGEYALGVEAWFVLKNGDSLKSALVYGDNDIYHTVRLAIVNVAAEMGKLK